MRGGLAFAEAIDHLTWMDLGLMIKKNLDSTPAVQCEWLLHFSVLGYTPDRASYISIRCESNGKEIDRVMRIPKNPEVPPRILTCAQFKQINRETSLKWGCWEPVPSWED